MGILLISFLLVIGAYLFASLRPKTFPRFAKNTIFIPPVLLILWIIATCFLETYYSLPSLNALLNLLSIIATIAGIIYMNKKYRLGFYAVVTSVLLHISSTFLTKFNMEIVIIVMIVDIFILLLLSCVLFLKNNEGNRIYNQLSTCSEPTLFTKLIRIYNAFSVVVFVFIMFFFPTWRSIQDGTRYFQTYYNEYVYYDEKGDWDDENRLWLFSHVDGEVKHVRNNYYEVNPAITKSEEPESDYTELKLVRKKEGSTTHDYIKLPDGQLIDIKEYVSQFNNANTHGSTGSLSIGGGGYYPPRTSSPSTKDDYTPPRCNTCRGSGKCQECGGDGKRILNTSYGRVEEDCEKCHGTGNCANCFGTGERYENVPVKY